MMTSKMHGVSFSQVLGLEWGYSDNFGLQFIHCFAKPRQILWGRQDCEVRIAAKLGCAVEYARLAAHQQRANSVRANRRKDFEYRVPDQVNRPISNTYPRVFPIPANA